MLTDIASVLNEIVASIVWVGLLQLHRLLAVDARHQVQ
jgi:hypothetical protein